MDEADLLTKLEELVLDENKIVTVKGFSQICEVHPNQAKNVMLKFKENNKDNVVACFMVAGYSNVDKKRSISIVLSKEEEVNTVKSSLSQVLSNNIYSLSKTYPKCQSDLYAAEVSLCDQNKGSKIPPIVSDPKITLRDKPTVTVVQKPTIDNNKGNFAKAFQPEKKKEQSTGIAAAFAKTAVKTEKNESKSAKESEKKTEDQEKVKPQMKDSGNKNKGGAIMAFVQKGVVNTKSISQPKMKEIKVEKKVEKVEKETDIKKLQKSLWSESSEEDDNEEPIPRKKEREVAKKPQKQMKRIIMVSSSSSEDEAFEKTEKKSALTESRTKVNAKEREDANKKPMGKEGKKRKTVAPKDDKPKPKETRNKKRKISLSTDEEDSLPSQKKADKKDCSEEDIENNEDVEMDNDDDDEDIIPPTPVVKHKGPTREYKTVKKTFQDEDGFFVTRKEKCLVEVQPEDSPEDPIPPKSPVKAAPIKNGPLKKKPVVTVAPSKQKQASISSFFKKSQ